MASPEGGRGDWRPAPRVHHFGVTPFVFFSFDTKKPTDWLAKTFFFLVITYFRTENRLVLQRRSFFLLFTYILADKGSHHEIPPRVPLFLATPLLLFTAKILQEAMCLSLLTSTWTKSLRIKILLNNTRF